MTKAIHATTTHPQAISRLASQWKRLQIFLSLLPCQPLIARAAISLSSAEECAKQSYLAFKGGSAEKHTTSAQHLGLQHRWMRTENGNLFSVFLPKVKHLRLEREWERQELIEKAIPRGLYLSRLLCPV